MVTLEEVMKRFLLFIVTLFFIFSSCKKDKNTFLNDNNNSETPIYPNASFYLLDYSVRTNERIFINNNSTDAISFKWDFGDGSDFMFDSIPIHSYSSEGRYTIKLVVESATGHRDSSSISILVDNTIRANFTYLGDKLGDSIYFSNQSTNGANTFLWTFGDGQTSIEENPKHVFNNIGKYNVTLVVSNNGNNTVSISKEINVYPISLSNLHNALSGNYNANVHHIYTHHYSNTNYISVDTSYQEFFNVIVNANRTLRFRENDFVFSFYDFDRDRYYFSQIAGSAGTKTLYFTSSDSISYRELLSGGNIFDMYDLQGIK